MVRLDPRHFGRNCDFAPWVRVYGRDNLYVRYLNASNTGCVLRAWGF